MRALTGFYLAMFLVTLVGCGGARKPVAAPQSAERTATCDDIDDQLQQAECEYEQWLEWRLTEANY
jgi:predicted small lipoprotein YifL